jgi:arylsulfatase A-like enzyme
LTVAKYFAMCEWFDETCGELLGLLDENQVREDTLVIYVTDNGWIQDPESPGYAASFEANSVRGRNPHANISSRGPRYASAGERPEVVSSIDRGTDVCWLRPALEYRKICRD